MEQWNINKIFQWLFLFVSDRHGLSDPKAVENLQNKIKDIYSLYDLIGFRYVFYNKEDLLKFYHHAKLDRKVLYSKNYIKSIIRHILNMGE